MIRRRLLLALTIVTFGCSTATIHRFDKPSLRGRIVGGSPESLVVIDARGRRQIVPRQIITDIDHPGPGWEIGGTLLSIAALFLLALHHDECTSSAAGSCLTLMAPALVGLGTLLVGAELHQQSEQAADDESLSLPPPAKRRPTAAAPTPEGWRAPRPTSAPATMAPAPRAAPLPTPDAPAESAAPDAAVP